jgi:hypothetical protein
VLSVAQFLATGFSRRKEVMHSRVTGQPMETQ